MKKLNKKGFTLIEMLVVIAIIAVLVAIIIPVVQTATEKAAAATNAANLRSIKAEATTDYLAGATETKGYVNFTAASGTGESATAASFTVNSTAPTAKKCGDCAKGATANILFDRDTEKITVYYLCNSVAYGIDDFAKVAEEGGTLASTITLPA